MSKILISNDIQMLVVHCSDTDDEQNLNASDIHNMHLSFGWDGIGYHKVIRRNGVVENGRDLRDSGAHAAGYNHKSVGVCLVGGMADDNSAENNFTDQQWTALKSLIRENLMF